jgi:hypothetical protein
MVSSASVVVAICMPQLLLNKYGRHLPENGSPSTTTLRKGTSMNFSNDEAVRLINTALQAGLIKLHGTGGSTDAATRFAELDATYLLTLLQKLQGR